MYYVHEIETFRASEIVEMTDHMKELSRLKENYLLPDDKFLIEVVGTNGIVRAQNIRNNKKFFFRDISLQHIVPELKTCLL